MCAYDVVPDDFEITTPPASFNADTWDGHRVELVFELSRVTHDVDTDVALLGSNLSDTALLLKVTHSDVHGRVRYSVLFRECLLVDNDPLEAVCFMPETFVEFKPVDFH